MTWPRLKKNTTSLELIQAELKARISAGYRPKHISINRLTKLTGLPRSTFYYRRSTQYLQNQLQQELRDTTDCALIKSILKQEPYLGHRRTSTHCKVFLNLAINHKRVRRIKLKYGLQTRYRRSRPPSRDQKLPDSQTLGIYNHVKDLVLEKPNQVWSTDFTYLYFQNQWWYFSTMKDNFTKEILGYTLGEKHSIELVTPTLHKAVSVYGVPAFHHSDQGSEYRTESYRGLLKGLGITISMSAKGKPTENGYQESFYSYFKLELGNPSRFTNYQELKSAIEDHIFYYNYKRIHSVIKTTPHLYRQEFESKNSGVNQPLQEQWTSGLVGQSI